jgi:hypothetical protein
VDRYWRSNPLSRGGLVRREREAAYILALPHPRRIRGLEGDLGREMGVSARTIRDDYLDLRADPRLLFYARTVHGEIRESTQHERDQHTWRADRELVWGRDLVYQHVVRPRDATIDTWREDL